MLTRRTLLAASGAAWAPPPAPAPGGRARDTVFLHASAGDDAVNAFIAWLNERMIMRHGFRVRHVRLPDSAFARVLGQHATADAPLDCILAHTAPAWMACGSVVVSCRYPLCEGIVIPADAPHRTGALLLARFLLSPETQARAAAPRPKNALPLRVERHYAASLCRSRRNWKNSTPSRSRRFIICGLRTISPTMAAIFGARK